MARTDMEQLSRVLHRALSNMSQSMTDRYIEKNAQFRYDAGLSTKIIRTSSGHCCEWCNQVAGKYSYPDVPKDVYRRHDNCDCAVEYVCGKNATNVHTKQDRKIRIDNSIHDGYDKREMLSDRIEDVTEKYLQRANPGIGELVFDEKTLDSDKNLAMWLFKTFGGNIRCLEEVAEKGKNPDALWNGLYWEFKKPTNVKRIDDRIRHGMKQLNEALERDGKLYDYRGIVVDISYASDSEEAMISQIVNVVQKRCVPNTDVLIKKGEDAIKIIRVHK